METNGTFKTIEPKILYFGTPVALISSLNEDSTTNIAPMSSFWALGWNIVLGLLDETKTSENLKRHPECVVNIPSPELWRNVESLAPLTGKNPVPEIKANQFRFRKDKFEAAGMTELMSEIVRPSRIQECPFHLEARVRDVHQMHGHKLEALGGGVIAEVEVLRVHADPKFIAGDNYIDPAEWSPLIYNFRHYFRLAPPALGKTFRAER